MTEILIPDRRASDRGSTDRRRQTREPFVEFHDLFKAYGPKQVLRGASLKVYRGEVLVILGGSGTGKSVTLRHMLGLEAPDAGRVIIEEEVELLVLHGVLHLLGHDHENDDGSMREMEGRLARRLLGSTRGLIARAEPRSKGRRT